MSFSEVARAWGDERHPEAAFAETPLYLQRAMLSWISMAIAPAARFDRSSSYGLKHDLEEEIGVYVPHDAFKGAMLEAGYAPKHDGWGLNWPFKIKPRYGRRLYEDGSCHTGFGIDRRRCNPVEVAAFDCIAAGTRIRSGDSRSVPECPLADDAGVYAVTGACCLGGDQGGYGD